MTYQEKSARKKGFNPDRRPCLDCMKEGKTRAEAMFDSLDESDRYCPRCKINKRQSQVFTYTEDDYPVRLIIWEEIMHQKAKERSTNQEPYQTREITAFEKPDGAGSFEQH